MAQSARRKRRRSSKWLRLLLFALLAGAIGTVVYLNLDEETPVETFPTVSVERRDLVDKLAETGRIELVRTVEVKSTTSGVIRSLHFETGDGVDRGRMMAVIEPDPNQTLQLFQKRSAVENARISLHEQEKDYSRKKTLFESGMLPKKDFEDADRALTRARNSLRLAELELEILETKANLSGAAQTGDSELDEVRVLAPISGVVIKREVETGEIVASGTSLSGGTVLFEIGDPSQMIVRADIAEIDIGDLRTGQEVDIVVDAFADTTYRGTVRWIAPVGEKKQGSTIVTFDAEIDILDREPRLRQGMSCDLDIIFRRREGTLSLPVEAVLELFDEEEGEQSEVKGRRGRFVTYLYTPADSAAAGTDGDGLPAGEGTPVAAAHDSAAGASGGRLGDTPGAASGTSPAGSATARDSTTDPGASGAVLPDAGDTTSSGADADPAGRSSDSLGASPGTAPAGSTTARDSTTDPGASGPDSADTASAGMVSGEDSTEDPGTDPARSGTGETASTDTAAAKADSASGKPAPPQVPLDEFTEVELRIGLETSTRIEVLSGLGEGDWVAADPEAIRRKLKMKEGPPEAEGRGGRF